MSFIFPFVSDTLKYRPGSSLNGKKILLAEDNEINTYVAKLILEEAGCTVTTAENGSEAVEIFRSSAPSHFDAILMDVRMPVTDGLEATRHCCIRCCRNIPTDKK